MKNSTGDKKGRVSKTKLVSTGITPDERSRMIAEAAYYRAEQRGFTPYDQMQDWLDAESDVDSILRKSGAQQRADARH